MTKCFALVNDDPYSEGTLPPTAAKSKEYINKRGLSIHWEYRPSNHPGLSRKHIFEAVDASLKRLETDYIDVLQIHRYDYDTPREETMRALHGIKILSRYQLKGRSSCHGESEIHRSFIHVRLSILCIATCCR